MFRIRDFSKSDAVVLTRIANEAFSDEMARGMSQFTPEGLSSLPGGRKSGSSSRRSRGRLWGFSPWRKVALSIPRGYI